MEMKFVYRQATDKNVKTTKTNRNIIKIVSVSKASTKHSP
jgi:hypothetical protein